MKEAGTKVCLTFFSLISQKKRKKKKCFNKKLLIISLVRHHEFFVLAADAARASGRWIILGRRGNIQRGLHLKLVIGYLTRTRTHKHTTQTITLSLSQSLWLPVSAARRPRAWARPPRGQTHYCHWAEGSGICCETPGRQTKGGRLREQRKCSCAWTQPELRPGPGESFRFVGF